MDSEKPNKNIKPSTKNVALFIGIGLVVLLLLFGVGRAMGVGRSTTTTGGTTGGGTTTSSSNIRTSSDKKAWENAHNEIRAGAWGGEEHNDLEWDDDLAVQAEEYVKTIIINGGYPAGAFIHSDDEAAVCGGSKCGENLALAYSSAGSNVDPSSTVQRWYDECEGDTVNNITGPYTATCRDSVDATSAASNCAASGHYTQVVWKDAKKFGCAYGWSEDGVYQYAVCQYDKGNTVGEFATKVPAVGSCNAQSQ